MFSARLKFVLAIGIFAALQAPARGQEKPDLEAITKRKTTELLDKANEEYRVFFKRPGTPYEFWAAIKFEMDLGKFDLAALHLKQMIEKEPKEDVDKDLVKLEQAEGMSAFLRLRQVRKWFDKVGKESDAEQQVREKMQQDAEASVEGLIERVTKAVETHLSRPDRIKKFIKQLGASTPEERAFAFVQLARSRERAVPYLIEAIRVNYGKPLSSRLRETMLRIGPETVPVYLEVFMAANDKDYKDIELRLFLLDIIKVRDDKRAIPYLWHLSASKKYPVAVREKAADVLASLLRADVSQLPPAKESLTHLAENYYQHKIPMLEGKAVQIWKWDGEGIKAPPDELTPYNAEAFFGERFARQALDLDPSFVPAQVVLLSLTLERFYRPKLDEFFMDPLPPKMHALLTTIDPDLVMRVLERGMDDKQLAVILPLVHALGERGEYNAAQLRAGSRPNAVVRALYYPDRRVQFAAMVSMLRMPANATSAVASERIVDLARRFLAAEPAPKALVVNAPIGKEPETRATLKELGFTADIARKLPDAFERAKAAADYDLVVLHHGSSAEEFPFILTQIRKSADLGGLPALVIVEKNREKAVKQLTAKDPNVAVIAEIQFKADDELKDLLDRLFKKVQVARLTPGERKLFSKVSLDTLWRMARGETQGYNIAPAQETVMSQIANKEYAVEAVEILGRLPGKEVQYKLAGIVTDPRNDKLRITAALELNRHLQKNGVQLDKKVVAQLKSAQQDPGNDPALQPQLSITMSLIARSNAPQTGAQLFQFRPDAPAPPAPPPPKEKEEKKDKDN